ncbi:uncharacterized protein LOC106537035 [Austrofundulus limnaeus]|uniref:Uncharacterized protein LOC106537035 n=1 Tax=Austrofundulus limnaeus TaxID=52670 RepID=A0A2I4DC98_AUSLI|nr:PREDICTED: uncharacterized protein LOC106537035 [Austrofundulus limnaeus]
MKWICKFCSFVSYNERTIVTHYKDNHRGRQGLSCIYSNCLTVLKSHVDFAKHIKEHKRSHPVAKLRCELCNFSSPTNIKQYFLHLKRHLRTRETVNCPFAGCSFKSRVISTFTAHKSRYHHAAAFVDFKPDLVVKCHSEVVVNDEDFDELVSSDSLLPEPEVQTVQNSIQRRIASLLLRLQAVLHVSQSAIQEIVDELFDVGECAGQITRDKIENILKVHNCSSEDLTASLTEALQSANPLTLLSREGPLGTEFKRQSFYRQNFTVIEPVEYVLNRHKKSHTVVYVPILTLLSEILKRDEVLNELRLNRSEQSGQYKSCLDGDYFKRNQILSHEDVSLCITLYIDDFEVFLDAAIRQAILNKFSSVDTVGLTPHIFLNGTKYSKGMILSTGSTSGLPNFGQILEVCIVLESNVCFIIEPFTSHYVEYLRSYHLVKKNPPECLLVKPEDLNDYLPLVSYFIRGRLLVTPKTFLLK